MASNWTPTSGGQPAPNAPSSTTKTAAVQNQLNEVVTIMQQNMDSLTARGERLTDIEGKTDNLQQTSVQFRRGANQVRKKMWWKDTKMKIIIASAIVVLLLIIILPLALKK
jgi:vesicle-associated membrane protein 4